MSYLLFRLAVFVAALCRVGGFSETAAHKQILEIKLAAAQNLALQKLDAVQIPGTKNFLPTTPGRGYRGLESTKAHDFHAYANAAPAKQAQAAVDGALASALTTEASLMRPKSQYKKVKRTLTAKEAGAGADMNDAAFRAKRNLGTCKVSHIQLSANEYVAETADKTMMRYAGAEGSSANMHERVDELFAQRARLLQPIERKTNSSQAMDWRYRTVCRNLPGYDIATKAARPGAASLEQIAAMHKKADALGAGNANRDRMHSVSVAFNEGYAGARFPRRHSSNARLEPVWKANFR